MTKVPRLGLAGLGEIAHRRHLPAIASTKCVELVAIATPNAAVAEVPVHRDMETMLAADPTIEAVVLCMPPQPRFEAARAALQAGKHVFLEKPPGATLSEVEALVSLAKRQGLTLFASWHSREASAVYAARQWLADAVLRSVAISWKEDVRVWHRGQTWIWEPGGFGVFDPGINALSILTAIIPEPIHLLSAELQVPQNCGAPIAASLCLATGRNVPIVAEFDFRQTGPQTWDIVVEADKGKLVLSQGGNALSIDGVNQPVGADEEYENLYRRFARLIASGESDVDLAPLRLVADAFLRGRTCLTEPFFE